MPGTKKNEINDININNNIHDISNNIINNNKNNKRDTRVGGKSYTSFLEMAALLAKVQTILT